jgi:hypothetical protein
MTVALQEQVSITEVDIYYLNENETDEPGWYVDFEYTYGKSDSFGPYSSRNAAKRAAWGG